MNEEKARAIAERIARGHAFDVHVLEGEEFPEVETRAEFADLIFEVLANAESASRSLRRGRLAFWNDAHRMLVIVDLFSDDGGTAFRPEEGKAYFRAML